jgi:hypothetical protein
VSTRHLANVCIENEEGNVSRACKAASLADLRACSVGGEGNRSRAMR